MHLVQSFIVLLMYNKGVCMSSAKCFFCCIGLLERLGFLFVLQLLRGRHLYISGVHVKTTDRQTEFCSSAQMLEKNRLFKKTKTKKRKKKEKKRERSKSRRWLVLASKVLSLWLSSVMDNEVLRKMKKLCFPNDVM